MKLPCFAAATLISLAGVSQLHAAPLLLGDTVEIGNLAGDLYTPTPALGDPNGLFADVRYRLNGGSEISTQAGMFVLDRRHVAPSVPTSWQQFLSFCLEPHVLVTPFDNPHTVNSLVGAGFGAASDAISELWGRHFGSINNDDTAGAFQVAVWELAWGTTDKNLATGSFVLTSGGAVKSIAQSWLDSLDGTGPKELRLVALSDNVNTQNFQDILTHQVPEPGVLALLGVGLAGIGLARRRSNRSQKA